MKQRTRQAILGGMVLTSSLALFPVCTEGPASSSKPQTTQVAPPQAPSAQVRQPSVSEDKGDGLRGSVVPATNLVAVREGRSTVREGDTLVRIEFLFEVAGFFEVKVAKIDAQGIELGMDMEIFETEHASNRAAPWRINYGQEGGLGETGLPMRVRAERGTEPGTAVVEVYSPQLQKAGGLEEMRGCLTSLLFSNCSELKRAVGGPPNEMVVVDLLLHVDGDGKATLSSASARSASQSYRVDLQNIVDFTPALEGRLSGGARDVPMRILLPPE